MNELIRPKTSGIKTLQQKKSAIQLTFHVPKGLQLNEELVVEVRIIESILSEDKIGTIEVLQGQQNVAKEEILTVPFNNEIQEISQKKETKIAEENPISTIVPYFSLKLKNTPMVYKIGSLFLKDIEKGEKFFGFSTLSKQSSDLHMVVYASFINYSLKKPVLVVVRDFADKSLDNYRSNFTDGTLWNWKTKDWGDICFVDYKQIIEHTEELKNTDLDLITHEFKAVLWALPSGDVQTELQKTSFAILDKINSVSFVLQAGETKSKELVKASSYYQCFQIPVKGVFIDEELKGDIKNINQKERKKFLGFF